MILEAYTFEELHNENCLEIKETKLKIDLLQIRLDRLERRNRIIARVIAGEAEPIGEKDKYPVAGTSLDIEDIEIGISTELKDKEGDLIRTGDRVKLLTPSKKNKIFKVGSIALVEGVQKRKNCKDHIKVRASTDLSQRTTRDPENLEITEPFKKYPKEL